MCWRRLVTIGVKSRRFCSACDSDFKKFVMNRGICLDQWICDESWHPGDDSSLCLWTNMFRSVDMQRVVASWGRLVDFVLDSSYWAMGRGFLIHLSYDSFLSLGACLARSLHFLRGLRLFHQTFTLLSPPKPMKTLIFTSKLLKIQY